MSDSFMNQLETRLARIAVLGGFHEVPESDFHGLGIDVYEEGNQALLMMMLRDSANEKGAHVLHISIPSPEYGVLHTVNVLPVNGEWDGGSAASYDDAMDAWVDAWLDAFDGGENDK